MTSRNVDNRIIVIGDRFVRKNNLIYFLDNFIAMPDDTSITFLYYSWIDNENSPAYGLTNKILTSFIENIVLYIKVL